MVCVCVLCLSSVFLLFGSVYIWKLLVGFGLVLLMNGVCMCVLVCIV